MEEENDDAEENLKEHFAKKAKEVSNIFEDQGFITHMQVK